MRKFNPLFNLIALAASLLLFSCQKELRWPPEEPPAAGVQVLPETDCKPAVFGLHSEPTSGTSWTTFMQKWYKDSKLTYLKALIGPSPTFAGTGGIEPGLALDWGEVSYDGNQVYLKDLAKNLVVMRVTVNSQGRPEASYYYNQTNNADNAYQYDTTYYYTTGSRLDSTISIYETVLTGTTPFNGWQKYKFSYDIYGSIQQIEGYPGLFRLSFEYDYSKAVSGIISNYHLNMPMKLMEYLELVKLPMRHALAKVELAQYSSSSNSFNVLVQQQYQDYAITGSGLVHSYVMKNGNSNNKYTFYNGWECGKVNSPMSGSGPQRGITGVDEFKLLYPFKK
jgi:hypothetical protein